MQQLKERNLLYFTSKSGEAYTSPIILFSCLKSSYQKKALWRNFPHPYYRIGARWYDPEIGLWTTPDPARQFHNPYSYVGGDPINIFDYDGMVGMGILGYDENALDFGDPEVVKGFYKSAIPGMGIPIILTSGYGTGLLISGGLNSAAITVLSRFPQLLQLIRITTVMGKKYYRQAQRFFASKTEVASAVS